MPSLSPAPTPAATETALGTSKAVAWALVQGGAYVSGNIMGLASHPATGSYYMNTPAGIPTNAAVWAEPNHYSSSMPPSTGTNVRNCHAKVVVTNVVRVECYQWNGTNWVAADMDFQCMGIRP